MREQRNHAVGLHERVIEAARGGDWDVLADYLNAGFEVTPDVRRLLIAILRREVKKPPKRTAKAKDGDPRFGGCSVCVLAAAKW